MWENDFGKHVHHGIMRARDVLRAKVPWQVPLRRSQGDSGRTVPNRFHRSMLKEKRSCAGWCPWTTSICFCSWFMRSVIHYPGAMEPAFGCDGRGGTCPASAGVGGSRSVQEGKPEIRVMFVGVKIRTRCCRQKGRCSGVDLLP